MMEQMYVKKGDKKTVPPLPKQPKREKKEKVYPIISMEEVCQAIEEKCGALIAERHGEGRPNKVVILPEAWEEMKIMLSYGRESPMNQLEQQFTGYGKFFRTKEGNTIIVVSHFIQVHTMNRSPISASYLSVDGTSNPGLDFLEYYRDEYLNSEAKYNRDAKGYLINPFLEEFGNSEYVLEGHTHPGVGVFFSATDKETGRAHAGNTLLCTFVCDPIRRQMLGAIGGNFEPADVIVYGRSQSSQKKTTKEVFDDEVWSARRLGRIFLSWLFK